VRAREAIPLPQPAAGSPASISSTTRRTAESRAPAPIPGPPARPGRTGGRGRFPPPGGHGTQVAGGSLVEIKGGFSKEDQQLRGNLPDGLPRKPEGFCGLGRPGLGSVRLSAPAETRPKPLRNGPENPDKGAGATPVGRRSVPRGEVSGSAGLGAGAERPHSSGIPALRSPAK